jgi:predicted transcriptional regulator of viral defense system
MSAPNDKLSALDFFANHPVFTHEEFATATSRGTERSRQTSHNILAHHLSTGRLVRIRRGLYATVPRGASSAKAVADPYLVATKLADDAVVAYHAALQFHGKAHSVSERYTYLTHRRARPFRFRQAQFVPVQVPAALRQLRDAGGGILERRYAGGLVRVTTLERTLVDVLDVPKYGGGWEELWRSLEAVEFFDLEAVVDYALKLKSALTVARVGFFLEQYRDKLMVEDRHLKALLAHVPKQPSYLDRRREPGKLVAGWNLVVPERLLARTWEEVP